MTSHDVVGRCRRIFGTRKVGHAGTLDPMATGVLVVGIERATKILGLLTATESRMRRPSGWASRPPPKTPKVKCCKRFRPKTSLMRRSKPRWPRCAAISRRCRRRSAPSRSTASAPTNWSVKGRPSSWPRDRCASTGSMCATSGGTASLVDVDVEVDCSSGTYIRALARDVGAALGVGGHLTALRRTRVGGSGSTRRARWMSSADAAGAELLPRRGVPAGVPAPRHDRRGGRVREPRPGADPAGIDGVYAAMAPDETVIALLRDKGDRASQ